MIGASKGTSTRSYQVLSTTNITSTGSQNYTIPSGVVFVEIEMYGAGGGGGGGKAVTVSSKGGGSTTTHYRGGGGGGGAYVKHKIFNTSVIKDAVINFTVGAGGLGGATNSNGTAGANTTLNSITPDGGTSVDLSGPSAGGGGLGKKGGSFGSSGTAGAAANGNITNTNGGAGESQSAGFGNSSFIEGGDGGDGAGPDGGDGGVGGVQVSVDTIADHGDASGGGGGGGASQTENRGGNGADGKVVVKAFG